MRITAALPVLLLLTTPLAAQVKEAPKQALFTWTSGSAAAATELRAAWEAEYSYAFAAAAQHARKALELDPAFALARATNARYLPPAQRRAEAERAALDAGRVSTAEALILLATRDAYAGQPGTGAPLNEAIFRLYPGDPMVATAHAMSLPAGQRLEAFRGVVKQFPDYVPAKLRLVNELAGALAASPAALAEATDAAQAALRLEPENGSALAAAALPLARTGRYDEASAYLRRAAGLAPTVPWADLLEGEIALQQNRPADARTAFERASESNPYTGGKTGFGVAAGLTLLWEGKAPEAIRQLEAVAQKAEADGATESAGYAHVFCALAMGAARDASAQQHIDAARRLGTTGFWVDQDEVLANAMAGQAAAARAALATLDRSATGTGDMPRTGTLHLATGFVLLAEKRPAEALAELKQVPNENIVAQLGMVEAYRALGRKAEAKAEREKLFARQDFTWSGVGMPLARYRLR